MKKIGFEHTELLNGFLKDRQQLVRDVTVYSVYDRFRETGRFEALKCNDPNEAGIKLHFFWDSDVAKWIEGVAYLLRKEEIPELKKIVEQAIDDIIANCDEDGYFNSYFLTVEKGKKFTNRDKHELYCAGHLIEAAIAYSDAMGDDRFLNMTRRFADYIDRVFRIEDSAAFVTPGHPELELALAKLYCKTKEPRYRELLKFFIDQHGNNDKDQAANNLFLGGLFNPYYNQDDVPLKERTTAEGHSVRCLYLLCGMADYALLYRDREMLDACKRVFDNIIQKRMYLTGGVGSTANGEAFTADYDLPSRTAYSETCASIAMILFTERMQNLEADSKYADIAERALYNGAAAGMSVDGESFFYVNPLEIVPQFNDTETSSTNKPRYPLTQRKKVFGCSCCPPNIVRVLPSIADIMYSVDDQTIYVHHYAESQTEYENTTISQTTAYPSDGKIVIEYHTDKDYIAIRIPSWCEHYTVSEEFERKSGYAFVKTKGTGSITVEFEMKPVFVYPNPKIYDLAGKAAIMRGPVVYCAEGCDNGGDLFSLLLDASSEPETTDGEFAFPNIRATGYRPCETESLYSDRAEYEKQEITLIPYYAFANRGEQEMRVWFHKK